MSREFTVKFGGRATEDREPPWQIGFGGLAKRLGRPENLGRAREPASENILQKQ